MSPEFAERLRISQATVAAVTGSSAAAMLRSTWRPYDHDATFEAFVDRAVVLVNAGARQSNLIGSAGWQLAGGDAPSWTPYQPIEEAVRGSLYGTANQTLRNVGEEGSTTAVRKAASQVLGVAVRHVTNAQQQSTIESVQRTPLRVGYMLVTRANPCYFCAMLASRGPVYKGDSMDESDPRFTGIGSAKVHDNCGCSMVAIGPRDLDANVWKYLELDRLWTEIIYGSEEARKAGKPLVPSNRMISAWRNEYTKRFPPSKAARFAA